MLLPLVLGSSPHLPVSVCGTGTLYNIFKLFSPVWFLGLHYFIFSLCLSAPVFPLPGFPSSTVSFESFKYSVVQEFYTCCPSATLFSLTLGPDLPWADEPSPGNLRLSMAWILTMLSLLIPAFSLLSRPHILSIMLRPTIECSSTTYIFLCKSAISVYSLAPVIFRATSLDQWAITHSLNEWLLLSQHPGCLRKITSFST